MKQVSFFEFSMFIEKIPNLILYKKENCEALYQEYWKEKSLYGVLVFNKSTTQFTCYVLEEKMHEFSF